MITYEIENVPIHFFDNKDEIKDIFEALLCNGKNKISFINPEIFMQQQKNEVLHNYFLSCNYNFVDGIGLLKAINKYCNTTYNYENRFPGTDFFTYLPNRKIKFFFYGSKMENILKAKAIIEKKYDNCEIVDYFDGYTPIEDDVLINRINSSGANILIVCKGCPKQELWINNNFDKLKVNLVFGNGGSIDFWSGAIKRAPNFMIKHGLEFIYRLFQNFALKRIKRQSKLIKFLFLYKLKKYNITKIDS